LLFSDYLKMTFSRLILLVTASIVCYFAPWASGHAYFIYPTPRNVYCANSSCTTSGTLNAQGPIWLLAANNSLIQSSPVTQTTCNGSNLIANASLGNTYDPGFQGITTASWPAGSTQTFQIFVSQTHPVENQTVYPTDGWQIRYRDGTQANSSFVPIAFIYVNVSTGASTGPAPGAGFQLGQIVYATITVPSTMTSDGIFQFFWRNNEIGPGFMWLSCVDVTVTGFGTVLSSSKLFTVFTVLLVLLNMVFSM
jgi:hypothetical protein